MKVQCELCPKLCLIGSGQSGECRVRINIDGVLRTVVYGYPCSIHIDPVEKKPLFHFLPGSKILSIATVGCNRDLPGMVRGLDTAARYRNVCVG